MSLIDEVLRRPEFEAAPPVLIDVGASGEIHRDWAVLAPYSICIAFEPDAREMGYAEKPDSGYRQLVVVRAILTDRDDATAEFHLTRSPYCSSTLRPRGDALAPWAFAELFAVKETTRLPATTLARVLADRKLDRVDWFKTDSQGTDVRLFKSLGETRRRRTLAAQFEPGILEAYEGEDTLAELLAFMPGEGFWLSELHLRGTQRLGAKARAALPAGAEKLVKTTPGWGEATYLNRMDGEWSVRDRMLAWVIATQRNQLGFALEVAMRGTEAGGDAIFARMRDASAAAIAGARARRPLAVLLRKLRSLEERLGWS